MNINVAESRKLLFLTECQHILQYCANAVGELYGCLMRVCVLQIASLFNSL